MKSFVCLFVALGNIMLAAQSNPTALINRPVPNNDLSKPDPKAQVRMLETYGKLPLSFEENQGQTDAQVKFVSRGSGYTLFLTGDEAVLSLRGNAENTESSSANRQPQPPAVPTANPVLRMKLYHANPSVKVTGADELPGKSNYFIGNDAKKWHTNVPTYAKIKYHNIYPGVDLLYYGNQRQLEYDFVVAPGADPRRIQFDLRGARKISRSEEGDLVAQLDDEAEVRWHKPVVYQEKGGARQEIAAHYVIKDKNRVGFVVADYDLRRPLFIDPLIYSTYLGGSGDDIGLGIAVDSSGNAYVTGQTSSADFPTMNPLQPSYGGGNWDAFVAQLNPAGSALLYSTYLGGSGDDRGYGIAVDSSGSAYVTGFTDSTNFPTVNPLQPAYGGNRDAFVAVLNPTGSALVYSTYLGGSESDDGAGIVLDSSGNAYITGTTTSTNFPTKNPLQPANGGGYDAFVAKINSSGSALVYSTYLGGSGNDNALGIAMDSSGNSYVTGQTTSTDFPTMNPLQPAFGGGQDDAFVAMLNPTGSALVYSTYLGGSDRDFAFSIAVDSSGNAYVTGQTSSADFPTMNPLQPSYGGGNWDAFVAQLNPTGSALVYSTYLGGSGDDGGAGIAVDSSANAYVTGFTSSRNFPTMNPLQPSNGGSSNAFVAKLNPTGSALVYSTYLGGGGNDRGYGMAVDSSGNAYVTGQTTSTNFPTMNPLQPSNGGGIDAFAAKIPKPSAFVTLAPSKIDFGNQTVGITSAPQNSVLTNIGELTLTITSVAVTGSNSGDFAENDNCGTSVPPHGSCKITVTFTPTAIGNRNATVSITDNAADSPQQLPLSGVGVLPAVMFSPGSLTFPTQLIFTTSKPRPVTLTNTGQGILLIGKIATTGEFTQTNDCGKSIPSGAHCTIRVRFQPQKKGVVKGTLSITDNAPGSPQEVPLTGTGTYVQLLPAKVNFGTQPVGTRSLPKRITLTNKGDGPVNIQSISVTGLDAGDFAEINNCGKQVRSGGSCFIKVTFKPLKKAARTAHVSVSDDGGGSPQKVALSGTGT